MKRIMTVAILSLGLAACAGQSATVAEPPQQAAQCDVPWTQLRASAPSQVHFIEVQNPAAFLKAFNASKPPSDISADQIFAIRHKESVYLFFIKAGCVTENASMRWEDFEQLRGLGV